MGTENGSKLPERLVQSIVATAAKSWGQYKSQSAKIRYAIAGALVLVLGFGFWFVGSAPERDYLNDLRSEKLIAQFSNDKVAVIQGKAFCAELEAGNETKGYKRQFAAVRHFCPDFVQGFKVIPTPEEQQASLLKQLRAAGFGGRYASDTEAVSHAKTVCKKLEDGGKSQGIEADFIAVKIYCNDFESGFRVLDEIKVKATFQIDGSRYGWFPSVGGPSTSCYGRGGYSDISSSTTFVVKNPAGDVLAEGVLGEGKGGGSTCKFTFEFTVLEGETKYLVSVGRRGTLKYSEAELKIPGRVHLFL